MWRYISPSLVFIVCLLKLAILGAAPLKVPTNLPLDAIDLEKAQVELGERDAAAFALFLTSQLSVLPDHMNKPGSLQDRSLSKKFYVLPLFQIAPDRIHAGGQEFAEYAMTMITEMETLLKHLSFDVQTWQRLEQSIQEHRAQVASLSESLPQGLAVTDPRTVSLANLRQDLQRLESEKAALQDVYLDYNASIDPASRQSVFKELIEGLQKLGVMLQANEAQLLESKVVQENFQGLYSLMARATKFGLFGSRQMIFDASYDQKQKKYISLYRRLRPDVDVMPLPIKTISVKLTASGMDSTRRPESPQRLFLGVNTGTQGRCGNNRTCNVMIDYNFAGAMAARFKMGKSVAPLIFQAEAQVTAPAWTGSVSCHAPDSLWESPNRWQDLVTNFCHPEGGIGHDEAARYHIARNLDTQLLSSVFQPSALSLVEKARFFQDMIPIEHGTSWVSAFSSRARTLASFELAEDSSLFSRLPYPSQNAGEILTLPFDVHEPNTQKNEIFTFDGLTAFCWKRDESLPQNPAFISSCQEELNTLAGGDTETGRVQRLCQNLSYTDCQSLSDKGATDENGLIREPGETTPLDVPSWEDIWR